MAKTEQELNKMKKDELITYADKVHNLGLPMSMSKDELINEIMLLEPEPEPEHDLVEKNLSTEGPAPAGKPDKSEFMHPLALEKEGRRTVIFSEGAEEEGSEPVKLSVNGRAYQAKRGVPVSIPVSALRAADNAIMTKYSQKVTPTGQIETISREVPRFPYRIVDDAE